MTDAVTALSLGECGSRDLRFEGKGSTRMLQPDHLMSLPVLGVLVDTTCCGVGIQCRGRWDGAIARSSSQPILCWRWQEDKSTHTTVRGRSDHHPRWWQRLWEWTQFERSRVNCLRARCFGHPGRAPPLRFTSIQFDQRQRQIEDQACPARARE